MVGATTRQAAWLSSPRTQSTIRLGIIALYSVVFMWGGFFDWMDWTETVLWTSAAILWVVILVLYIRDLTGAPDRRAFLRTQWSLPILLVAPVFMFWLYDPAISFVFVVVAYILELRNHASNHAFAFSFALVGFVGILAGMSMVEVENDDPGSGFRKPSDAFLWAFASLLRINYGRSITPTTDEGRLLATVVGVCALIAATLFTAQVVGWVLRPSDKGEVASSSEVHPEEQALFEQDVVAQLAAIQAELAALKRELGTSTAPSPPATAERAGTVES